MSERRSVRSRKRVDYSKYVEDGKNPSDSDDDFQDSTPPAKKAKTTKTNTNRKKETIRTKGEPTNDTGKDTSRRPTLEEKLYQRDLEAAIQASKRESQTKEDSQYSNPKPQKNKKAEQRRQTPVKKVKTKKKKKEVAVDNDSDSNDNLQIHESESDEDENLKQNPSTQKTEETHSTTNTEEKDAESDYKLNDSDDGDIDEDSSNDDDDVNDDDDEYQTSKPSTKQSKPSIKPRMSATVTPVMKRNRKGKSTGVSTPSSVSSSASNSPSMNSAPIVKKTSDLPKLPLYDTPKPSQSPGQLGLGGVNIKDRGPPIRVGLSRTMKVKPLHSNVVVKGT